MTTALLVAALAHGDPTTPRKFAISLLFFAAGVVVGRLSARWPSKR